MSKKKVKIKFIDDLPQMGRYRDFMMNALADRFDIELSDEPDYILCGCFSNEFLKYDCIRIQLLGENITPDFNLFDYAIGYDFMEYGDRYLRYPSYARGLDAFDAAAHKHERGTEYFLRKEKFCNFIYTNSTWAHPIRKEFFEQLCQYKKVDSGGGAYNNIGYRVHNKREFQEKYKFSIAFENSRKDGYTTEKIMDAFAAGTIPIYWGSESIVKDFNPKSFINVFDFSSLEECIAYVRMIDENDELYLKMQQEPIFVESSLSKKYYENRNYMIDFLAHIFEQPYESAKKIYNRKNGYNRDYTRIISRGWLITMIRKWPYSVVKKVLEKK